ncbi:MAG: GntR family transcriptional regulator [Actinomycetota bacterium]|nr:GntR family transcriptional regulator [Actinomycetota bacterium]
MTGSARDLRRRLGPVAWAVLEVVVLDARADAAGCFVAGTNVRRIGDQVGVSKDTAAAALTRLTRLGLVQRRPGGRGDRGRFGRSVYIVHLNSLPGVTLHDPRAWQCRPGPRPEGSGDSDAGVAVPLPGERPEAKPSRFHPRRNRQNDQASLFVDEQDPKP